MSFLFGGAIPIKSKAEQFAEYKAEIRKAVRHAEREESKSRLAAVHAQKEIRKYAIAGNLDMCKIKAKELVRAKTYMKRHAAARCSLASLANQIASIDDTKKTTDTLARLTSVMQNLAKSSLDPVKMHHLIRDYERSTSVLTSVQESIQDSLDEAFDDDIMSISGGESEDALADQEIANVLTEMGINTSSILKPEAYSSSLLLQNTTPLPAAAAGPRLSQKKGLVLREQYQQQQQYHSHEQQQSMAKRIAGHTHLVVLPMPPTHDPGRHDENEDSSSSNKKNDGK